MVVEFGSWPQKYQVTDRRKANFYGVIPQYYRGEFPTMLLIGRQMTAFNPRSCRWKRYDYWFGTKQPRDSQSPSVGGLRLFLHSRLCGHGNFTVWLARPASRRAPRRKPCEVLSWETPAADLFVRARQDGVRIGSMDLKIACIALAHSATLLTRNTSDFAKVPGLTFENGLE